MAIPQPGEQSIFNAARLIQGTADRCLYVARACGEDRALQARLEALLRIHDEKTNFLEPTPEGPSAAFRALIPEGPGTVIGPYKLVQPIGEGGMGAVFLAEQSRPVQRQVALKIIKPGMDSRRVIARFEAERQALALMDHPNIAKVFDGGMTQGEPGGVSPGRPFFVMELVQGVPLTRYCDEHGLTLHQRLELFVQVCHGVQHAHQKGIIHRDLKPTNVLVAVYDGKPVPKIIDFGVAKAVGQKLTEQTLVTELGFVIGTPDYMSPEQADPNQLDIDTRSDIYSLGVLLYELLTGTTPLRRETPSGAGLLELLRLIREEEPTRPSIRLSTTEELPASAIDRGLERKKLSGQVHGDLDWIVMKCLEKDRSRRYETAAGLARDIERYLRDEPVEASPPGAGYRLGKFARRHKKALVTGAAFLLLLLAGTVISTWQAVRVTAERDAKEEARQQAVLERQRADEARAIAEAVNDFLQKDLLSQASIANQPFGPDQPERNPRITVRELLDRAEKAIAGKFPQQPLVEASVRQTLADAYFGLGEFGQALPHAERALALRTANLGPDDPDTLASLNLLAVTYQAAGRLDKALPLCEQTLAKRKEKLGPNHPDTLTSMNNLAAAYTAAGQLDKALPLLEETLAKMKEQHDHPYLLTTMNNLAGVHLDARQLDKAIPLFQQTLAKRKEKNGPDHHSTLTSMNNLAEAYAADGQLDKALPLHQEALAKLKEKLGPYHSHTLTSMNNLAEAYAASGRLDKALALHEETLAKRKEKLGPYHRDTLQSMNNLAVMCWRMKLLDRSLPLFEELLPGLRQELGLRHPHVLVALASLAVNYRDAGRLTEASERADEFLTLYRQLPALSRRPIDMYVPVVVRILEAAGQSAKAELVLRQAVEENRSQFGAADPRTANALAALGFNLLQQQKWTDAVPVLRECLALRQKHQPQAWETFDMESMLGAALLGQQKYADAEPLLVQGYAGMKERAAHIPNDAKVRLTQALQRLLRLREAQGNEAEADRLRKALANENKPEK